MIILAACAAGFILDLFFGDPAWIYHPIRIIGHLISGLEKKLYKEGVSPGSLRRRGTLLWIGTAGIATLVPCLLLWAAFQIHPVLYFLLQSFWCWQLLATKSLKTESMKVKQALDTGTIEDGRKAVSMIVGRDTKSLTEEGVVKAAVETVAENTSDGVTAPLLFLALGGLPLGMVYKAVNTMDSMVGYRNERYRWFGTAAARLDDVLNWIPARLSGLMMCLAAALLPGCSGRRALRVFFRDRRKHSSPNSAHTEAACAGALQLQLAGPNYYFGQLVDKPTIGDDQRPVEALDILRAGRILYATAFFALLLFCGVPLLILLFP